MLCLFEDSCTRYRQSLLRLIQSSRMKCSRHATKKYRVSIFDKVASNVRMKVEMSRSPRRFRKFTQSIRGVAAWISGILDLVSIFFVHYLRWLLDHDRLGCRAVASFDVHSCTSCLRMVGTGRSSLPLAALWFSSIP